VLGNKCAGQHNLKTVHFIETLQVIFWHVHQQYVCFFASLYLLQDGKLFCNNGGGDPLQALLEGALGQQAACQLGFHFHEEIKGRWCEI
jgi:hypothetical protein